MVGSPISVIDLDRDAICRTDVGISLSVRETDPTATISVGEQPRVNGNSCLSLDRWFQWRVTAYTSEPPVGWIVERIPWVISFVDHHRAKLLNRSIITVPERFGSAVNFVCEGGFLQYRADSSPRYRAA